MIIFIGADHRGFKLKNELARWLRVQGHTVKDMGPDQYEETDDYPDYGFKVATAVAKNPANYHGVLLCASGVGMAVAANKVKGIRAALVQNSTLAQSAKQDDDVNVLALGASFTDLETAKEIITTWLNTNFAAQERFQRRLDKITRYEAKQTDD